MTSDPNQIRQELEGTRNELTSDVDALADRVNPGKAVRRPVDRAREAYHHAREKIMGRTASMRQEASGQAGEMRQDAKAKAGEVRHRASETASSAAQTVRTAPQMAREKAEGSPLAAGLIAFGAGVLIASLLPPSQEERQAAGRVKEAASKYTDRAKQEFGGAAQHAREDLSGPAHQAMEQVKSSAGQAGAKVREESQGAARHAGDQARQAAKGR